MGRRFKVQTPKRVVTHIVTDVSHDQYDDVLKSLKEEGIPFDGILIECNSKKAYVWLEKRVAPVAPLFPPDAAIA